MKGTLTSQRGGENRTDLLVALVGRVPNGSVLATAGGRIRRGHGACVSEEAVEK